MEKLPKYKDKETQTEENNNNDILISINDDNKMESDKGLNCKCTINIFKLFNQLKLMTKKKNNKKIKK